MSFMKNFSTIYLAFLLAIAYAQTGSAQTLTFSNGGTPWTVSASNTDADGVSTLSASASNYVSNLNSYFSQGIAPSGFDASDGGWVFSNSEGTVLIANKTSPTDPSPALALGDPFVTYNFAALPTDSTHFTVQFTSTFPAVDYNPSLVKASFGLTLTDGSADGSGSNLIDASETATLSLVGGGTVSAGTDLSLPAFSVIGGDSTTESNRTAAFPGYLNGPSGSFNQLTVTITADYSSSAQVAVTGRVDVVPEPSSIALMLVATGAFIVCLRVRRNRAF